MREKGFFETFRSLKPKCKYFKNPREMHKVINKLPEYIKAILIELSEKPLSLSQIKEYTDKLAIRMGGRHRKNRTPHIQEKIDKAIALDIIIKKSQKYYLSDKGKEIAAHMKIAIPVTMKIIASEKAVSMFTITIHVILSILKMLFGFLSRSAGLIADGIDNTADTVSSILIWFGIKIKKEKITSLFIIVMMFISVGGIVLTCIHKITAPLPIESSAGVFILSFACGLIMLMLSAYQYFVGKKTGNFALMCQAIDSRNHFITSLLVCAGIFISSFAKYFKVYWLYYSDAVVSIIIGVIILKSAVELCIEFFKTDKEKIHVSHFLEKSKIKVKSRMILRWLKTQLKNKSLTLIDLDKLFKKDFCENTPKVLILSGMGYRPENSEDLHKYLEKFIAEKRIILKNGKYRLCD